MQGKEVHAARPRRCRSSSFTLHRSLQAKPMNRRQWLAAALALAPAFMARANEAIRWSDVRLLDGRTLPAAQLDARTVVVYVWASWCPFCARQSPMMQALHQEQSRRSDGLIVLGFTLDRTEKAATDYLAKHGYTFASAMAMPQLTQWFGARRTLPEVYVVRGGRVLLRESGEMFAEDVASLARFASSK
jgi:thiol-disulfide isomerase/thioredoxin